MKQIPLFTAVAILAIGSARANDVVIEHPTFIEAAVFFLTGREPPERDPSFQPPWMIAIPLSDTVMRLEDQPVTFEQSAKQPCIVYEKHATAPYIFGRYNFDVMPGPRTVRMSHDGYAIFNLGRAEAYCQGERKFIEGQKDQMEVVPGTFTCTSQIVFGGPSVYRRLSALTFIRENYCHGLPQPPLVAKPY